MGERRLLPYIHRYVPTPSSVYYDNDLAYWYGKRRRYPPAGGYFYEPSYHHRLYPRRYYDDVMTRRSLPAVRHFEDYYVQPRAVGYNYWPEAHCSHCQTLPRISSKLVPSMHYDERRYSDPLGVRRDEYLW